MGKLTKVFASGSIGNVIFYERLGTACARSMPATVRQTDATRAAAGVFGKAKAISRELRDGLKNMLPNPKAREVMYITDNAVATWLRNGIPTVTGTLAPPLSGLEFSTKTTIYERFRQSIEVNWLPIGEARISIPAFDAVQSIIAPAHTISVRLSLVITCSTLEGTYLQGNNTSVDIDYKNGLIPASEIKMHFEASTQSIYLLVAALRYTIQKNGNTELVMKEEWLPATVVSGYFMR